MKKTLLLTLVSLSHFYFCQSWDTQGNAGTNSATNFLGTKDAQDLVLKTNNLERMRINSAGNVAVGGLPDPSIAFRVYGRSQVITDINSDTFYVGNTGSNISGGASLVFLRYSQYQPNNPGVLDVSGVTSPGIYESLFSLKSNGKLLIGSYGQYPSCSDCNDYRVFIKNGIRTEKVKVDIASANGWADYVFDKNYKLLSLSDVEKHIDEKGHLPNVPSAEDVVKNGINLGEMDAKLLEKIEELTLYVIQLNKDVKQLGEENKELKKTIQSLHK
jgi:Pyruvate/2-oxoacid:ferredoxin oxidoreductase gamma subunit